MYFIISEKVSIKINPDYIISKVFFIKSFTGNVEEAETAERKDGNYL